MNVQKQHLALPLITNFTRWQPQYNTLYIQTCHEGRIHTCFVKYQMCSYNCIKLRDIVHDIPHNNSNVILHRFLDLIRNLNSTSIMAGADPLLCRTWHKNKAQTPCNRPSYSRHQGSSDSGSLKMCCAAQGLKHTLQFSTKISE